MFRYYELIFPPEYPLCYLPLKQNKYPNFPISTKIRCYTFQRRFVLSCECATTYVRMLRSILERTFFTFLVALNILRYIKYMNGGYHEFHFEQPLY